MQKKIDKLVCRWSKSLKSINYIYPQPQHGKTLNYFFKHTKNEHRRNLLDELEELGYDMNTLKFEIKLKKQKED